MISILIITEDIERWSQDIARCVNGGRWTRLGHQMEYCNDMFRIRIAKECNRSFRGMWFTTCVLDKPMHNEEEAYLRAVLHGNIVHTAQYYRAPRNRG